MCLPIDSCFGFGTPRTDDYQASRTQQPGQQRDYNGNGNSNGAHYHGNSNGNGNGVRRDPAHVVPAVAPAPRGRHGHAGTAAQDKAAAYADEYETLKQQPPAAWNGKVAADGHGARGGAPHSYYYANERAHKDATATAADQERY